MAKFSIGIDFGTESARAVLVRVDNGEEVASAVHRYADGVIDERLPGTDIELEPDWALQNPADYLEAIKTAIPAVLREAGISPDDVIGIGIDFTSCTMLPTDKNGVPLCMKKEFKNNPHAWVKLWKHHAAQPEADRINQIARERGEKWLERYGGKISSEWFFPKCLQILNEAPEIYQAADKLIEAADWVVWQLTGEEKRSSCTAGYKAIWDPDEGFPSEEYFRAVHPEMENIVDEKMTRNIYFLGQKAGGLTAYMASVTGLKEGTPVAVANVDAHVSVPAMSVTEPGKMVMIMGTSICHMMVDKKFQPIPGACGIVKEGILPGYFGYEAGQSAVGDIYAWMVKNTVPPEYWEETRKRNMDIYQVLEEKAFGIKPGETGLLALDWWNGNRSVLVDADLTGVLLGYTLETKPEEIYRAIIEATAFGTYKIINSFEEKQIKVNELYACGGLPEKSRLVMQIFADVTGRKIKLSARPHTPAFGSAMFGAVAAGRANGGYNSIFEAVEHMAYLKEDYYSPDPESHKIYQQIFSEYDRLHDYFGRGENDVMKRLKKIKLKVKGEGVEKC